MGKRPDSVVVLDTPLRAESMGGESGLWGGTRAGAGVRKREETSLIEVWGLWGVSECSEAEEGGGKGYGEEEEEQYEAELEEVLRRSLGECEGDTWQPLVGPCGQAGACAMDAIDAKIGGNEIILVTNTDTSDTSMYVYVCLHMFMFVHVCVYTSNIFRYVSVCVQMRQS